MKVLAGALLLLSLPACTESTKSTGWTEVEGSAPEIAAAKKTAAKARDDLAKSLLGELTSALEKDGPARGIEVCKSRAPAIAADVGRRHGVRIGRTSFRLRNAGNRPPEWAAGFVEARVAEPKFVKRGTSVAALYPIKLGQQCVMCHGKPEQIPPVVRDALARAYPADQAVGFEPGEVRGWFWVEVP